MFDAIVHACAFVWALIGLLVGGTLLLIITGVVAHEFFVVLANSFNRNNTNYEKDNS